MTSTTTDVRFGVNSGKAVKVPCKAATTANITLSGEQTIDGVACVTGDRVLVKDQTDGTENGIYNVDTSSWTRTADANDEKDFTQGTLVYIGQGSTYAGLLYGLTTSGTIFPGTTSLTFSNINSNSISAYIQTLLPAANAAAALTILGVSNFAQTLLDDATADAFIRTLGLVGLVFPSKAAAVSHITTYGVVNGQAYFITSDDGGPAKGITGASVATFSDDSANYCGTNFIPTGGDGSSAIVFDSYYTGTINAKSFGATGKGVITNEQSYINDAFTAAYNKHGGPWGTRVYIPSGIYKTSAAIVAKVPYYGDDYGTEFRPQGAFECFNVQSMWLGEIHGYRIDYTDVGAGNITSACHGHWLLKGTTTASQQLAHIVFHNIQVYRAYDPFYQSSSDKGNQWMVAYKNINSQYCKDYGFNVDVSGSSGSLMMTLEDYVIESPNGIDSWSGWTTGKGFNIAGVTRLSIRDSTIARPEALSTGGPGTALTCTNCPGGIILDGFDVEGAVLDDVYTTASSMSFINSPDVEMNVAFVTPDIDPGAGNFASYAYFDASSTNVVVNNFSEVSPTVTTGGRKWMFVNPASTVFNGNILDGRIARADTVISPRGEYVHFASDKLALETTEYTRRRAASNITSVVATATTLISIAPYSTATNAPSGLFLVQGTQGAAAVGFTDLILITSAWSSAQTVVVVSSNNTGAADARTYSMSGNNIQVTIPVNVYNMMITGIDQMGA